MSESRFDLVIIGAGPGGYVAAMRAAELGMSVACVDKAALGGTCLNVGCIPSKALLESSERFHQARAGLDEHGIVLGDVQLDLAAMMVRKERIVQGMTAGIGGLFKKHKVTFFAGTGSVPEPGTVDVAGKEGEVALTATNILLALGSEPVELADLPFDGSHILSSTEALALPRVPERMVVIGAGAIGLELGSVWQRLGSEVIVVEFMDSILPGMDGDISTQLQRVLKRQGLRFQLQTRATGAQIDDDGVTLSLTSEGDGESEIGCDCVLVAVGRRPYRALSGIDELGIARDQRGFVTVDERFETSVAGVYAIGDLIPGPMLAHKAEAEGIAAVEIISGKSSPLNYGAVSERRLHRTRGGFRGHDGRGSPGEWPAAADRQVPVQSQRAGPLHGRRRRFREDHRRRRHGPAPGPAHSRSAGFSPDCGGSAGHRVRGQRRGHCAHHPCPSIAFRGRQGSRLGDFSALSHRYPLWARP